MTLTFINSKINAHTYIREDEFMDTIIEKITGDAAKDNAILERAAQIIKKGGLVAFPTETVYGLGGMPLMLMLRVKYTRQRAGHPIIR